MTDLINKADDKELSGLAELKRRDAEARSQYSKKNIVKVNQREQQIAADRWKYYETTEYKNGAKKNKCVGVAKIIESKKVLIKNRGVDMKKFFPAVKKKEK